MQAPIPDPEYDGALQNIDEYCTVLGLEVTHHLNQVW